MNSDLIASIAVEKTVYSFDKLFDYKIPQNLYLKAKAGARVLVPFGRGNKKRQGMIMAVSKSDESKIGNTALKSVLSVLDDEPVLSENMLSVAKFMKEYYFCTYYDAIKTMLPAGINYTLTTVYGAKAKQDFEDEFDNSEHQRIYEFLRRNKGAVKSEKILDAFGLTDTSILDEMVAKGYLYKSDEAFRKIADAVTKMVALTEKAETTDIKLTQKQQSVMDLLKVADGISAKEICYFTGVTSAVLDTLHKKDLIYFYDEEVFRMEKRSADSTISPLVLSEEQQKACDNLYAEYFDERPHTSLLYGVTGSGKTSVFISLIERVINDDKGIIVMVPEISLTPQFIEKFSQRFGDKIAVFHSALSLGERLDEYKRVQKGLAKIVIGTRSAVFAPFDKVGLIIMDEEQEYSYKSESSPRYHAREIARYRCRLDNALLVLSSATPSIETYYYAKNGYYSLNKLSNRYGTAQLPEVITADMNLELQNGNTSGFSKTLLEGINHNLENGKQSIILLNRRGHNTFVTCRSCSEPVTCPNCSISLTYHSANNRLMCHYCGYSVNYTDECPNCHERALRFGGSGTQKAEKDIFELFPNARILRMDTDTTTSKYSYKKMISSFERGEYDILIGTQMVAKGLNFPNVTLVGVLNTDQMLYADDYRSYERSFSLLTQVVGRSGRGDCKGLAVIQSYTPDNLIISMAVSQNYEAFFNTEINVRKAMLYPPFADICVVGFVGTEQALTLKGATEFLNLFINLARSKYPKIPLRILGPSPALVVKVSNKYRYKLIIKCKNNSEFRGLLSAILIDFEKNSQFNDVSVYADMNSLSNR